MFPVLEYEKHSPQYALGVCVCECVCAWRVCNVTYRLVQTGPEMSSSICIMTARNSYICVGITVFCLEKLRVFSECKSDLLLMASFN